MAETDEARRDRATKLLEERVRRDTIVDTRLEGHDRRLASINGQLERGAKATEIVAERLGHLEEAVLGLRADLSTKDKVTQALSQRAGEVASRQITKREFWMGIAVLVISVLSVAVQAGVI